MGHGTSGHGAFYPVLRGAFTRYSPPPAERFSKEYARMLMLYYAPGACSMASHIVASKSQGEKYEPKKVDLAGGELAHRSLPGRSIRKAACR